MEIGIETNRVSPRKVLQLDTIERKKKVFNYLFISFFVLVVFLQSFISFNKTIPIRVEFATQALFYFITIIMMAIASFNLLKTISNIFGLNNTAFLNEISQVKYALVIFTVCYSLRVIRNSLVVYFWSPCFTVHRDLTTNFVNTIFYIISDWFAIFAMLRVHHHNYSKEHLIN